MVDIDVGWVVRLISLRAIKSMSKYGAAAVHIEDQVMQKRCGHPGLIKPLCRKLK